VVDSPLPPGTVLGSEAELMSQFGVSRGVLRQAIGLLQYKAVAETRRGWNGGLVAARPDSSIIVDAATTYLDFERIDVQHVFVARVALEVACARMAAVHIDDAGRAALLRALEEEETIWVEERKVGQRVHTAIAQVTQNPALVLFVDVLTRLTFRHVNRSAEHDENERKIFAVRQQSACDAHTAIIAAILRGDADDAAELMGDHLQWVTDSLC
jgi:DNA-binding FadR family transcriptional regulator